MGYPAHEVPEPLRGRLFTREDAAVFGLTLTQLNRGPYDLVTPGLWQVRGRRQESSAAQEIAAALPGLQQVVHGAAGSHTTAAILLEMRLPWRLQRPWPLHITAGTPAVHVRRAQVVGHRAALSPQDLCDTAGMLVTSAARTVLDLAASTNGRAALLSDDELVAVVDGLICRHRTGMHRFRPAVLDRGQLERELDRFGRRRGVGRLRRALEQAAAAVDSPLETAARLCLEAHGLTGWETDLEVTAPDGQRFWPDLADKQHRLSVQVEGAHHDQHDQRKRDIRRQRITQAAGWTEIRVSVEDLRVPDGGGEPPLIAAIRAARSRRR